jgi:hypothetical protein
MTDRRLGTGVDRGVGSFPFRECGAPELAPNCSDDQAGERRPITTAFETMMKQNDFPPPNGVT